MDYLAGLNEKQREAALHQDGPLLILAGAGSGKTSTMTKRIAYLIKEKGISPYNILAVTFTNKAANEMKERVEALIGENTRMWILTFHSTGLHILKRDGDRLGYGRDFVIYDPKDQATVVKGILKALNLDEKSFKPTDVLKVISDNKEQDISPKEFLEQNAHRYREKIIGQIYEEYVKVLRKNNAMDFDDLICNAVKLLERNPDILESYRNRFKYIMVDEYQDTNYMQYRLVKMLAEVHNNICVVGDDDQCIYQWRGADINNILDFEKDFKGTKVIKLEQNYRSHGNILAAAHSVVEKNLQRKSKKLWTDKDAGEKVNYHRADNEKDEAAYIAQEISIQMARGRAYKDFAILYRINAQSRTFEEALNSRGIPYRVLGGIRYYDRKEIKDMMAYMRLMQNPADDVSFERIINEPKRGMGEKSVDKIREMAAEQGISMMELLFDDYVVSRLPAKASVAVKKMVDAIKKYHVEKDNMAVSDIYDCLLNDTGYLKALEESESVEAESRIENIMEFKTVIQGYEKENPEITLAEFMENLALLSDIDNHDEKEDAVVLMTMHSAKGLEFPVVFMPGMEDKLFPSWRSSSHVSKIEEERRLCYVGMTRAKERLFMTNAAMRTMFGRTEYTVESPFMREINPELIQGSSVDYVKKPVEDIWKNRGNDGFSNKSVRKPFDYLAAAKADTRSKAIDAGADLKIGDRVKHGKFGEGLVVDVNDKTVLIMFDSVGEKKIGKGVVPLKKL